MRKAYDTLADYDEDYRFSWGPEITPLAPRPVEFLGGRQIRVTPMWPEALAGGHLVIEGLPGHSLGVGQVAPVGAPHPSRIESVAGDVITLEAGSFEPAAFDGSRGTFEFYLPRLMLPGSNPAIMRKVWAPVYGRVLDVLEGLADPLVPGMRIAVIGSGFAYEAEVIRDRGYSVVGVDTSALVQAEKSVDYTPRYRAQLLAHGIDPDSPAGAGLLGRWTAKPRTDVVILNEDASRGGGRAEIRQALGGGVDWAISSFVLPVLDDAEAVAMNAGMAQLAPRVAHYTSLGEGVAGAGREGQDARFNWKSLVAWKVLLAPSVIISNRYEVV